jgi:hypothetical protein
MITNPNRFIRGLSDLAEIVDDEYDIDQIVTTPPATPVGVVAPPTSAGDRSEPSSFTLEQAEFTLSADGAQNLSLPDSPTAGTMLFINGFLQSRTAYEVINNVLVLPESLDLYTDDLIMLTYIK